MTPRRGCVSRRRFLKTSATSIAGLSVEGGIAPSPRVARAAGYQSRVQITPDIDNTHVVCVHDDLMTTGTGP